ncbi:Multiple epidermal growth factor-like domains protein 8 [Linnemannia zychae]|nr:Multiple epidermal growth factor-like domains protein 8 [Linnemannia zychae]
MSHPNRLQGSSRRKPSVFSLSLYATTLLATFLFSSAPAHAQAPTPVQEMAFMRGGNYLYVQGGKFVTNDAQISVSTQLAALDLSKSWATSSPVWKMLAPGPAYNLQNGIATPDNKTLITFYNAQQFTVNIYSVDSNSWQYTTAQTSGELLQAIRTIIDPKTGLVYIDGASNMNVYNPSTRSLSQLPIPPQALTARFFAGAVYNPARRSIMYMGGVTGGLQFEPQTYITEYILDTNSWGTFPTVGDLPTPRCDHCMAISEDSNTIVIFGGRTPPPGNFTGSFYILDVPSKTWTQGPAASTRLYSACAIVGDQFVVWGGYDGKNTIDGPPIIYSFPQKKWIEQYTPPEYFASMPSPAPPGSTPSPVGPGTGNGNAGSGNSSSSSSSSDLGGILGGVLGSLCVVALAGVVYLYMKRRSDKAKYESQAVQRITQQAERTNDAAGNNNSGNRGATAVVGEGGGGGGGGDDPVAASGKYAKSGDLHSLPPYVMTVRNPQNAAALTGGDFNPARNPQDANAMGLNFGEPHNRHDPQFLPVSPLNTPMGPDYQQQYTSSMFIPGANGTITPTIYNPSTPTIYDPSAANISGMTTTVGYTTIPVQTSAGLAYMSVPVQTNATPSNGIVTSAGYGYAPVPVQLPMQNMYNGTSGIAYTSVPVQSYTPPPASHGAFLQPSIVSAGTHGSSGAGTPTMGYAGFSPVQGSDKSSPGSAHRSPVIVSGHSSTSGGSGSAEYCPPHPHPAASGP